MGMSPRMKAKKGRFGVGGLPPTVSILLPINGAAVTFGTPVVFSAAANDDINGNVSSAITWTNDYDAQTSTGANPSFTFVGVGSPAAAATIVVTASYTDGTTPAADTVSLSAT